MRSALPSFSTSTKTPFSVRPPLGDARAGADVEALLAEDSLGFFDDVVVHAGQDGGQQLDDGDLGAESLPDGSELEADDAAADDDEVRRERAGS